MPTDVTFSTSTVVGGATTSVRVTSTDFCGVDVTVELMGANRLETHWLATLPISIAANGEGSVDFEVPVVSRETVMWPAAVGFCDSVIGLTAESLCVIDGTADDEPRTVLDRIEVERSGLLELAVGDPAQSGATEHRVTFAVEGVSLTQQLRAPGLIVRPVGVQPDGETQRAMTNRSFALYGSPSFAAKENWSAQYGPAHPWVSIHFPQVWAVDHANADALCRDRLSQVLGLLALNRGARGRLIGVNIEARQADDTFKSKMRMELPSYRGNLAGGFLSGESQEDFVTQAAAVAADPLLKLCVDLYGEALRELSADARYFRLWSVLETLATSRVAVDQKVILEDGNEWESGATTKYAAPRVYELVRTALKGVDIPGFVAPAPNLHIAIRAWYGRRNATAHSGRFDRGQPGNAKPSAWAYATMTPDVNASASDSWLDTFGRVTELVLRRECQSIGRALI